MGSARFVLKEPKSNKETLVFVLYHFDGIRLKYSTQMKIEPKYWNEEKQLAKSVAGFPSYPEFNQSLKDIKAVITNCEYSLKRTNPNFSKNDLKLMLDKELRRNENNKSVNFLSWLESQILIKVRHQIKGTSKRVYDALLKHLKGYSNSKGIILEFNSFDIDFYNKFLNYMIIEQGLSNNTAGKRIATLKTFLNLALENDLITNTKFKSRLFKVISEEVINIYLTTEEIEKIHNLDLSIQPSLDRARDLFLIGCYTGLRYSDFTRIRPENLKMNYGKLFINIRTQKTGETITVPAMTNFIKIWEKYNNAIPKEISNQKMNMYLKEIAKKAELNDKVIKSRTVGGSRKEEVFEKWQMVSTHTARRSFATNAYLGGLPAISIMIITGHKTEKSFMKYIKITEEENAVALSNHSYFK